MKKYLLLLKALLGNSNISTNESQQGQQSQKGVKNLHNLDGDLKG